MTTGFRIKEIRENKNMTQQELAEKSNVSRSIISELETGKRTVSKTDTLLRIARTLGVPFRDIFLPWKFNELNTATKEQSTPINL